MSAMAVVFSIKSFSAGLIRGRVQDEGDGQRLKPIDEMAGANARVGQTLRSKWHLDALLGQGGMACVYAATHRNGRRGAVKILHPEMAAEPVVRARFLREGYLANKVDHAGAVAVLDDDQSEDGTVFVVMELLEGETVQARAEARPTRRLEVREVVFLVDRLLDVLRSAHDKGIIHRDLKPENLFLTSSGQLKVLDFGIARILQGTRSSISTKSGSVCGTPAFMPPEQARGLLDELDGRSDLWAVGATMFALLAGREVHGAARTVNELLLAAMTQVARKLGTVVEVPAEVAQVVDRALMFEAEQRWPDARSMQVALRDAHFAAFGRPIHATLDDALRASFEGDQGALERAPSMPVLAPPAPLVRAAAPSPANARASTNLKPLAGATTSSRSARQVALLLAALAIAGIAAVLTRRTQLTSRKQAHVDAAPRAQASSGARDAGERAPEASKPHPYVDASVPGAPVTPSSAATPPPASAPAARAREEIKRRPSGAALAAPKRYVPPALER